MTSVLFDHKPFKFDPRSNSLGGCEKAVVNLAVELQRRGHQVGVFVPELESEHLFFHNVKFSNSLDLFYEFQWEHYVAISHCLRVNSLHTQSISNKSLYMHDNSCWRAGPPNISDWDRIIGVSIQHIKTLIYRSKAELEHYKFRLLRYGIKSEYVQQDFICRQRNQKHIIYAGAIVPEKDIKTIIAAFELVSRRDKEWHLHLAGTSTMWGQTNEYETKLKAMFSHLNSNITWHGLLLFDELFELFAQCGICIVPSSAYRPDPAPLSAIEAAAAGCVTIGAPYGGIPEITFETIADWSANNLATKLQEHCSVNPNIRYEIKHKFGRRLWHEVAVDFLEIIEE